MGDGAAVLFNVVSVTCVAILVLSVLSVAGFVALNFSVASGVILNLYSVVGIVLFNVFAAAVLKSNFVLSVACVVVFDVFTVSGVVGLRAVCVDSVVSPVLCCLWGGLLVICERNV